ncbi:MAG TPA: hypothetical protein VLL76_01285 [Candidatus Omnitrophota bacterium]|nr:hypothetical protein [Candidatus Omnitrophota bacterium]
MRPAIPVVQGKTQDLLQAHLSAARALMATARRMYTPVGVRVADRVSRAWMERTGNPLLPELDALAAIVGEPGLHLLNASYEWGCTTGVSGGVLLRTLDWPFSGLGRHVAVLDTEGAAGRYLSVTWPGFAGVLTAMAPGRFAVAINQAKAFHGWVTGALEWPVNRWRMLRSPHLPPAHLLRKVCDEAPDYATALRMLTETPICLPVFFTIAGPNGEGAVIEREPARAHVHPGPAACANHWHYPGLQGTAPRLTCRLDRTSGYGGMSHVRHATMLENLGATEDFRWLQPPVLCRLTRLACVMDPGAGSMSVMGLEGGQQATEILQWQPDSEQSGEARIVAKPPGWRPANEGHEQSTTHSLG